MREKIDGIMRDETLTRYEKTDQILALIEPQMLTQEEADALVRCWSNEALSRSRYDKVDWQTPLYLKLKKMAEGR